MISIISSKGLRFMEQQNQKLFSFQVWQTYAAALCLLALAGLSVWVWILAYSEAASVGYWIFISLLFFGAAGYLGLATFHLIRLGWAVQKEMLVQQPEMNALRSPLVWSNGLIAQEKVYRALQQQQPERIEQIRAFMQKESVVSGMLSLLPGRNASQQKLLINFYQKQPQPVRVIPQIQPYVWGKKASESFIVRFLQTVLHKTQQDLNIAELWFGAHKKNPGRVQLGVWSMDLDKFSQSIGSLLLGTDRKDFGQLFKVLDAVEPLSLQMHDRYKPDSKNECWMIVIDEAQLKVENKDQKIAELYLGFRPIEEMTDPVLVEFQGEYEKLKSEEEQQAYFKKCYTEALQEGITDTEGLKIKAFCNKYEVQWESNQVELYLNGKKQSEDVKNKYGLDQNRLLINVPGATVHALAFGTIYELQETADKTLRLYDQGRNDPNRPLHIDESMGKLDFTLRAPLDFVVAPVPLEGNTTNLIRTPLYALDEVCMDEKTQVDISMTQAYHMLIVTESHGENCILYATTTGQKVRMPLKQGDMLIVPASQKGYALFSQSTLKVLKAYEASTPEIHMLQVRRGVAFWEQPGFFEESEPTS
jgi:mannose-6-phosphate isomerase class I